MIVIVTISIPIIHTFITKHFLKNIKHNVHTEKYKMDQNIRSFKEIMEETRENKGSLRKHYEIREEKDSSRERKGNIKQEKRKEKLWTIKIVIKLSLKG